MPRFGNPPFIRFQHFEKLERDRAFGLLRQFGYRPSGLRRATSSELAPAGISCVGDGNDAARRQSADASQAAY